MARQIPPAVDVTAIHTSVDDLIERAGDLKGELVAFAQSPRLARRLDALLFEAADEVGYLDEASAVQVIDRFALQHQLADGRTVVERFVAQRRPRLSDDEREMVLGWRDVVEGCFEVRRLHGDAVEVHNLLDDLVYRVFSTMGRRAFAKLRKGMFLCCRIVPVHPATDAWLISGHIEVFPKSARRQIAQSIVSELAAFPEVLRRNPALLQRAWDVQAEHRAQFIAQVGSDFVLLPPLEAQETLREHYRRVQHKARAKRDGTATTRGADSAASPDLRSFPDELLAADTVALIYDEVDGLNYYRDFGRLDAMFADPTLARDRTNLTMLREWLYDESVAPLAIRRLVQRHPDGADPVFRALTRKPAFSWARDGEELLRRHKKALVDREPLPSVSIVGQRLAELLHAAG